MRSVAFSGALPHALPPTDPGPSMHLPFQAGSLEVPIHAYPTMGGADFPRRIDFGRVALGEGSTRRVVLNNEVRCSVGIVSAQASLVCPWTESVAALAPGWLEVARASMHAGTRGV